MMWGYEVSFTHDRSSGTARYCCEGFATREAMERDRAELLKQIGWTPPRWWQFWRRYDTRE